MAADLMTNEHNVFRNMGPNGPVDMVAVSPKGTVHLVQVTLGRRKEPWGNAGFSSHKHVKVWNVLAICYPDAIEYRTREGKPMHFKNGELKATDKVKVRTIRTRRAKRPGIHNLPRKSPEELFRMCEQRIFQNMSSSRLDRIINDGPRQSGRIVG